MKVSFKQGIISAQDNFLSLASNVVSINADTQAIDITFSHGNTNYLFTEPESVVGAWGPFAVGNDYWLYWDINLNTGLRTFGYTTKAPLYGSTLPTSTQIDLHFFDVRDKKMKVWNGFQWEEKIRVFSGKVSNGSTLIPNALGSQVALSGNYYAGYILFDINETPIKRILSSNVYLLTTEDNIHTQYDRRNGYRIDSLTMDGIAIEPISTYQCLTLKGANQMGLASNVQMTPCIGISVESSAKNGVVRYVTKGFLSNYSNWNWSEPANTPLFVGATGEITTNVPQNYSLQKIGYIVSPDTIFVDIRELIILADLVAPTPTPTPTPSYQLISALVNENGDYIVNENGDTIQI